MLQPIEAVTSYLYKYCDTLTSRQIKTGYISSQPKALSSPSLRNDGLDTFSEAVNPPPYGNVPSPPSYNSSLGGLSLVDRCDSTFKIYHRDLVYLSKEWARRKNIKADILSDMPGGPHLAPNRIEDLREMFISIVQHKPCNAGNRGPPCDCRSVRWAHIKQEWLEVMHLLGNLY